MTNAVGEALILDLLRLVSPLLRIMLDAMPVDVLQEGKRLYAEKPDMYENDVTWTQAQYRHVGLRAEYIRVKCIQRFTEAWEAMRRTFNAGGLRKWMGVGEDKSVPLRVASLGGGPAFELLAVRRFCERFLPQAKLELISLDLIAEWQPYAESLGIGFNEWDVMDGKGVLRACDWEMIDLAVISYVFNHYMTNPMCFEWLAQRLNNGTLGAIILISRKKNMVSQIREFERRGARVTCLMRQPRYSEGKPLDHRQLLITSGSAKLPMFLGITQQVQSVFPNVPHEENKDPRDHSYHELIANNPDPGLGIKAELTAERRWNPKSKFLLT
eukprot:gnl/MRDRNA2_/MRDRNA2_78051_c0_seq1.p1 gnl/MRDRNA2_/MRDRNA2_78051_c0~~gnl/MRDRNA2_/MRDRNA2_78051_c0_seq1.p1  ORF type:complete len:327 (+),score=61.91 gnl/MRDRNA2_/MRDRNA2_78051_c0_seq1:361-1341(+)